MSDVLELLANGASIEEILADYPCLERDDILAAAASTVATWAILFALGLLLYGQHAAGIATAVSAATGWLVVRRRTLTDAYVFLKIDA